MESRHAIFIASLVTEEKLHVFYSHLVFPWNPVGKIRGTHLVSLLRLVRMQSCFFNCVQSSSQRCSFFFTLVRLEQFGVIHIGIHRSGALFAVIVRSKMAELPRGI
jgi:hypothetical protein